MISMIDEVYSALKNSPSVTALVPGGIHPIRNPDSVLKYPYITFFEVSNQETESADDEEYANDREIQVDIWSKSGTVSVTKAVQKVMRALGFTHQCMPDDYEDGTKIFHKPIRFTITKEV